MVNTSKDFSTNTRKRKMNKQNKLTRKGKNEGTRKLDNQIVGNAGMYFACYRLSELGLNVMPTARNAKGIDILAYTPDGKAFVGIQVKTVTGRTTVPIGKSADKPSLMGDIWCIVVRGEKPAVFVMTPKEVLAGAEKHGDHWWLHPKAYDSDKFRDGWSRIVSFKRNRS